MPEHYLLATLINVALCLWADVYFYAVFSLYLLDRVFPGTRKPACLLWMFHVSKWPALVALLTDPAFQVYRLRHLDTGEVILDLLLLAGWYFTRNSGDDDWWQKRKKKIAGKVKVSGSKLIIVLPEPA